MANPTNTPVAATAAAVTATPSTVAAVAVTAIQSLAVRFVYVQGKGEKLPIARAIVSMPAPMDGLTLTFPIFADRDKSGAQTGVTVSMPGGRFSALGAEQATVQGVDGKTHFLDHATMEGSAKVNAIEPQIKTAFYLWLKADNKHEPLRIQLAA